VLNNPRPAKGRPGRRDDATPAARGPGQTDPPTPGRPGATAPPVLNAPTSGRVGPDPAVRGRPGQRSTGQPGAAGRRRRPDVEWVGTDAARAEAAEPVLDRPEPPLTGQAVSRLEEVPARLRRARAESQPAGPARTKPGTVPPELAARRGAAETPGSTDAGAAADDQRVVLDEDAFSVETPGGGVLGKQREDKSYRPEPPPALGGGG
jgi:hypothetical protein